jgi:putative membrane protein
MGERRVLRGVLAVDYSYGVSPRRDLLCCWHASRHGQLTHMSDSVSSAKMGKASDHLANERTFLAWLRTSISIIVFGFVVARFGITLREFLRLRGEAEHESGLSLGMGIGFMVLGILMALTSSVRYHITMRQLDANEFKPAGAIVTIWALVAALFGVILAVYLIYTARTL